MITGPYCARCGGIEGENHRDAGCAEVELHKLTLVENSALRVRVDDKFHCMNILRGFRDRGDLSDEACRERIAAASRAQTRGDLYALVSDLGTGLAPQWAPRQVIPGDVIARSSDATLLVCRFCGTGLVHRDAPCYGCGHGVRLTGRAAQEMLRARYAGDAA